MDSDNERITASYIENAITSFSKIMANKEKGMFDAYNRANKGELFVLHFLAKSDSAALPSELSMALNSSTGRISALLGALEKKEQIEREIDRSNRRNILVTITEAGRDRVEAEMKKIRNIMMQVFVEMGETDTEEFIRLLTRFYAISHKYIADCGECESSQSG